MKTIVLVLTVATAGFAIAADTTWRNQVQPAVEGGLRFLATKLQTNGAWAPIHQPAITALALTACMEEPSGRVRLQQPRFIRQGYDHLLSSRNSNGSFG